jgi:hypothetical protein
MTTFTITKTYKVTLPEKDSSAWVDIRHRWWEDEGHYTGPEPYVGMSREEFDTWIADTLAYYVLEKSHVGDYTDLVEEVNDSIEGGS